jgi:hypothetical protein
MVFRLILSLFSKMVCPRGGGEITQAFVITPMIVVLDERIDLGFEVTGQIVILQQDPVFQGLVPSLEIT